MTSVIIVQYNNSLLTRNAIQSFKKYHTNNYEIILVDNGSTELNWIDNLKDHPDVKIICLEKNLGFGSANNIGVKASKGNILLLLNNDTITTKEFIYSVENAFLENDTIGIIGPRLFNEDGSLQLSFGKFPSICREMVDKLIYKFVDGKNKLVSWYFDKKYNTKCFTEWVTGAALFIKKDLYNLVGGFDESFFMYFEDKDLCHKVFNAGQKILYLPSVSLIHLRGASATGPENTFLKMKYVESQILYYKKYRNKFEQLVLKLYLKLSGKYIG